MNCVLQPYKLAWLSAGHLLSSMHATLPEARAAEKNVPQPRMIMELTQNNNDGQYAWKLLPGPWANAVKYWEWIALVILLLLVWLWMRRG